MSGWLIAALWTWGTLGFLGFILFAMHVAYEPHVSKEDARLALSFLFGGLFAPIALPLGVVYLLACGARVVGRTARKADLPELLPPVLRGHKETGSGQLSVSSAQGGELSSPKKGEP